MRTLLAALTALMLLATPVVAGDFEDALAAANAGDFQKAFRLWKPLAEQGNADAQFNLGFMYDNGDGVPKDDAKAEAHPRHPDPAAGVAGVRGELATAVGRRLRRFAEE